MGISGQLSINSQEKIKEEEEARRRKEDLEHHTGDEGLDPPDKVDDDILQYVQPLHLCWQHFPLLSVTWPA